MAFPADRRADSPASLALPAIRRLFWVVNTEAIHAIAASSGGIVPTIAAELA